MLLLSLLILLAPLATYLLILAGIHRRARPTVMSGTTETIGLLAASSGLLLFVVPGMLRTLYGEELRAVAVHRRIDTDFEVVRWKYSLVWGAYYLMLVAGAAGLIWWRRGSTVVLDVDAEGFRHALERTLAELDLSTGVADGKLHLRRRGNPESDQELSLEPFPALAHLTLRWSGRDAALRRDIERKLAECLGEDAVADTWLPGTWLLVMGSLLFGMTIFVATLLALRWWWL